MTASSLAVTSLRTEYRTDPIGINVDRPRLSWSIEGSGFGRRQQAYRIVVASSADTLAGNAGDLWDTGETEGDQTGQIAYGGRLLVSGERAWWKVRVRDEGGQWSGWSAPAFWEAGLLQLNEWAGHWISHPGLVPDPSIAEAQELDALVPPPLFRRRFSIARPVFRARLYITARGVYEAYLNGTRIGDQVLAPGWTDYNIRIQYQTFDLTADLIEGENVLAATVAPGWFAGYVGWKNHSRHYGTTPQFLAQLVVEYDDGSRETIGTDEHWRTDTGALRYADMLMGEYHDARRHQPGWNDRGFDDSGWSPVQGAWLSAVALVGDVADPVRAQDELPALSVTSSPQGGWIFDLGQNIAGWVRLRTSAPAGTVLKIRHAEILDADGSLYVENLRGARATDTFIPSDEMRIFEPVHVFHGFRFVEVTGLPGPPVPADVTGVFVGSDIPSVWSFDSSDPLLNQLQRNIDWGQRDNFLSIPTDCPQRDERLGWTGDAQIFAGTAAGNRDVAAFFTKWMQDLVDAQSGAGAFPNVAPRCVDLVDGAPAWADCGVILPWTMWQAYGDTHIIDQHWTAMEQWMAFLLDGNPDLLWQNRRGPDFGEWLSIGAQTPKDVIATAFWAYDARLMAEMARATGRDERAGRYDELFQQVCAAFMEAYVDDDARVQGETQACYLLALQFGLLPEAMRPRAVEHLVEAIRDKDTHLSTGFVGCSYLLPVLTAHGHADLAYRLLHTTTFPSWKYSILHGATTIWERWDGWTETGGFQDPGMNSFNHYSFGSVGEWIKNALVGIAPDRAHPGYRRVRIAPQVHDSLSFAEGTFRSLHGPIRCQWKRQDGGTTIEVTIPANVEADVRLPSIDGATVNGVAIADHPGVLSVRAPSVMVGSGAYTFTIPDPA